MTACRKFRRCLIDVHVQKFFSLEKGHPLNVTELSLPCHAGTHVDAPNHIVPGGRSIDDLPLDSFVGPGAVVPVRKRGGEQVTAKDLEASIHNVRYFKESSRDITKISRLIEQIDLAGRGYYFTTMQPLLATLMMGGSGATMPPPGTRIGAQVVRAFRSGEIERARYWQRCFSLFPGKWAAYGLPPVMKSAMKHFGVDIGDPSRPYSPASPRDHAQIGQFLKQVGLLDDPLPASLSFSEAAATLAQEDIFLR